MGDAHAVQAKPQVRRYWSTVEQVEAWLGDGEVDLAQAWDGTAWALARRASAVRRLDSPTRRPTTNETNRKAKREKRLSALLMVHDRTGGVKNQLARKNPEMAVTAAGRAPPRTPAPTAARR